MSTRKEVTRDIAAVELQNRKKTERVSDFFGVNTFSNLTMKKMISAKTYLAFKKWQDGEEVISSVQADEIANAMMEWAIAKGATSFTHWFQPMTGLTAEKHDGFIDINGDGSVLEKFSGSKLIHGEPDASSFPSGGLRATFEARGYTAWDPSSPAFIAEVELGQTLCIPSIFISYTGEALDKKLPLLRSDKAINKSALNLIKLFGNDTATSVTSTCGAEQEYFLIDEGYVRLRPDILLAGRTLLGAPSPKGQQLDDQYFGSIKERMLNYMNDVADEAYKLGIPVTTRHNEVAPHQYEFAPIFEKSNIAADHNQLLMDIMKKTAKRHDLECLLHEKPFAGINGSGKHLNWSLEDSDGKNLLNPGDTPESNLQFLTVLVSVIKAVNTHADVLRASVASAGNEHRLGANEAPPAIVSIFLGEQLATILKRIEVGKEKKITKKDIVNLGISHLPSFIRDATDRNRTSPFAFTGAKFEFRALGSALNISTPITVINTIVAEAFDDIVTEITAESKGKSFESAVITVLARNINENKTILFEGNNYSDEWVEEAKARGLSNIPSSPEALKSFVSPKTVALFKKYDVLSKTELESRYSIWLDIYNKVLDIEGRTLIDIVQTQILPAAYDFQIEVGNSLDVLKDLAADETIPVPIHALDDRKEMFAKLTADIYYIRKELGEISRMLTAAEKMDEVTMGEYFYKELKSNLSELRSKIDDLESIMPDDLWVLPKYREMLFIS